MMTRDGNSRMERMEAGVSWGRWDDDIWVVEQPDTNHPPLLLINISEINLNACLFG